ncbi:hypothetical protein C8R45DRAFT_936586 [Mycena sanguinolenta]|nr:hypothetical protein C8R45DRAFT_936586 [Mycena sanguinolenta]
MSISSSTEAGTLGHSNSEINIYSFLEARGFTRCHGNARSLRRSADLTSAMEVPQELIEEIITKLDLSEGYDDVIAETLKSCALVSSSFVERSQAQLFARISVSDHRKITGRWDVAPSDGTSEKLSERLSALLSCSPHLTNYIRILDLCYNSMTREASFVPQILSAVTALTSLTLTNSVGGFFPVASFAAGAFSLSSLRSVELSGYQFRNAFDLESLLSKAKCLKELTLRQIGFNNFQPAAMESVLYRKRNLGGDVKLESVCLDKLHQTVITSMLDSFTAVDIRHLKSLCTRNSDPTEFLRANSRSIQNLKMIISDRSIFWSSDTTDPRIMAGDNSLTSIDFEVDEFDSLPILVPLLGDLRNLTALKTVGITFRHRLYREHMSDNALWDWLDKFLESLPASIRVDVYAAFDGHATVMDVSDVDSIKKRLPSCISSTPILFALTRKYGCQFSGVLVNCEISLLNGIEPQSSRQWGPHFIEINLGVTRNETPIDLIAGAAAFAEDPLARFPQIRSFMIKQFAG